LKAVKKENIKDDTKNVIVEIKKRLYRGEIIERNVGAIEVLCKDTGMRIVCGKNKLRRIDEACDKLEVKVEKVGLLGIREVSYKFIEPSVVFDLISGLQFKEAKFTFNKDDKFAKVVVGDVCLNTELIADGITIVDKTVARGNGKFIQELKQAEYEAKSQHLNIWRFGDIDLDEVDDKKENKPKKEKKEKKIKKRKSNKKDS